MAVEYQEIRTELEADGFRLDDEEYTEAVNYARRKAKSSGKDESYMPYLLPDVIREWITRKAINSITLAAMEIEKIFRQEEKEHGTSNNERLAGRHPERIATAAH